jgi:hypothetical protein
MLIFRLTSSNYPDSLSEVTVDLIDLDVKFGILCMYSIKLISNPVEKNIFQMFLKNSYRTSKKMFYEHFTYFMFEKSCYRLFACTCGFRPAEA